MSIIIRDDDWAEWIIRDPIDIHFSYIDNSIIQKSGSNCLKAEATGNNAIIIFGHEFSNPLDLSSYNYISFWFYGVGNNDEWYMEIDDGTTPTPNNSWGFFNDTTVGWRLVTFKMSDILQEPDPLDWSNIVDIWFWNNARAGHIPSGTIYYFDFLVAFTTLPSPTPVPVQASAIGGGGANVLEEEQHPTLTQESYLQALKEVGLKHTRKLEERLRAEQK